MGAIIACTIATISSAFSLRMLVSRLQPGFNAFQRSSMVSIRAAAMAIRHLSALGNMTSSMPRGHFVRANDSMLTCMPLGHPCQSSASFNARSQLELD